MTMVSKKPLEKIESKKLKKNSQMLTTMICLRSLEKTEIKTVLVKATCMIDKESSKTKKMLARKETWKTQIWLRRIKKGKIISLESLKKSSTKSSQE